jgi:hypothetical protein
MARFSDQMVTEVVQRFWAAMQRGEFITDAAAEAGTYRKKGARWLVAAGDLVLDVEQAERAELALPQIGSRRSVSWTEVSVRRRAQRRSQPVGGVISRTPPIPKMTASTPPTDISSLTSAVIVASSRGPDRSSQQCPAAIAQRAPVRSESASAPGPSAYGNVPLTFAESSRPFFRVRAVAWSAIAAAWLIGTSTLV